jgi:RNA polymerase sigma factor (sigma-70 family)
MDYEIMSDIEVVRLFTSKDMNDTHRLLQEYTENSSEAAFEELVARYIDLVYSTALRRMSGDVHRARDVVQTVFTDLARKASVLPDNVMLGGWLHRHSCFVASNICRTETRREAREKEAMENLSSGSSDWEELAPALDEAIELLEEPDRVAIILRFFERADLRTVGAALNLSDDAAQKRVSRALQKLRVLLETPGSKVSLAALTTLLGERTINAAPAGWTSEVSTKALIAPRAATGAMATLAALCALPAFKAGLVILLVAAAFTAYGLKPDSVDAFKSENIKGATTRMVAQQSGPVHLSNSGISVAAENFVTSGSESTNILTLTIIAADSGMAIPNVPVDYRATEKDTLSRKKLTANRAGICKIDLGSGTLTELQLITRVDGFADTRLRWQIDHGEKIPQSYTVRLIRGVQLSGRVLDEADKPIADARVGFDQPEDPSGATTIESLTFGGVSVRTDVEGRWRIDRIAENVVGRISGGASHEKYVEAARFEAGKQIKELQQMRLGTHVFHLGNAVIVRGIVLDGIGKPVPNAKVLIGRQGGSGARAGQTDAAGRFEIEGCRPGKSFASAEASAYAPLTTEIDIAVTMAEVRLVLAPGKTLRLRVVNRAGDGIPNAKVWLNTFRRIGPGQEKLEAPLTQTDFRPVTDSQGRVTWQEAPDRELVFDFRAAGYMSISGVKIRPDEEEHLVILQPALKISGTVSDARSGAPISRFKIGGGLA